MKQKLFILWLMLLVGASGLRAAEAYTYFDPSDGSLNFCYDNYKSNRGSQGFTTYDLNTGNNTPAWSGIASQVKELYFFNSFANYRPTSCYKWAYMMVNLLKITNIYNLVTTNVTNMSYMFTRCDNLISGLDVSGFNTSNVTDMSWMFSSCHKITSLNVSKFSTAKVTRMDHMFYNCDGLTQLNLSNFNTSNVTTMSEMFAGCSNLTSLNVSSFNTSKVTTMSYMFTNCSKLTTLNVSNFTTSSITTSLEGMFKGCSKVTSLTLNFWISSSTAQKSNQMLYGCSALKSLTLKDTGYASDAFYGVGTASSPCTLSYSTTSHPTFSTITPNYVVWNQGYFKNQNMRAFVTLNSSGELQFRYSDWYWRYNNDSNYKTYVLNTSSNTPGWYDDRTSVKNVVISSSFANARPTSCRSWFSGMEDLESITGMENLKTNEVTTMEDMFKNCSKLTNLYAGNFNTANVTDMTSMFYGCNSLVNLNVGGFQTNKLKYAEAMFYGCKKLTALNVSGFNIDNLSDASYMFYGCESLTALDVSRWNLTDKDYIVFMFGGCKKLESLDLSSCNFALVSDYNTGILVNCTGLKTLKVSASANNLYGNACNGVGTQSAPCTLIYPDGFTPEKTAEGNGWYQWKSGYFKDAGPEPYAVLSTDNKTLTFYYDTERATRTGTTYDMNTENYRPGWYVFGDNPITSVVFDSSFADARPITCNDWFYGCTNLTSITGMEYLNTSQVTSMESMFTNCQMLENIDVSHFNTSNVKSMAGMFSRCFKLAAIDVSHFDTSKVPAMMGMFNECNSLESLDVSNFIIPAPDSYSGWGSLRMFADCSGLKTLVVPATAGNLADDACEGVGTQTAPCTLIYPSGFTPEKTSEGDGWYQWKNGYFKDGIKPYAVVDGSTLTFYYDDQYGSRTGEVYDLNEGSNAPGWNSRASSITQVYFSSSFNDARPTSCYRWFSGMSNMHYGISGRGNFNTEKVTDMSYMFEGCSSLEAIQCDHIRNTKNVTNTSHMFAGCSKLKKIEDISRLSTSNVTDMSYMFEGCSSLTSLYLGFDTKKVTNMSHMFKGCSSLTELYPGFQFRTSNVTDMAYMFADCSSIASLDLSEFTFNSGTEMTGLLNNCSGLKVLTIPSTASNLPSGACDGVGTKSAPCSLDFPDGFTLNPTATGDGWFQWKSGYFTDFMQYAVLDGSTLTFYYDNLKKQKNQGYVYDVKMYESYPGWWTKSSSVTSVVFDHSYADARPLSCWGWFCDMNNLQSIIGIENLNTDEVKYMGRMFQNCSSLTNLDVSGFNTGNVIEMAFMFYGCSSLTSLDVSGFDTGNLTDMQSMFSGCTSLTSLDVSHFNTEKVDIFYMLFSECSSLKSLDLGNFNFSVKESTNWYDRYYRLLYGCSALQTLTIPATANLWDSNACDGVGSQSAPCTLIYPDDFTPEKTSEGDGWYVWKDGYFKDAEPEPYAVLSTDKKTLTFYYDNHKGLLTGTTYDLNTGSERPGWFDYNSPVTNVVFDSSFADARPTSCKSWFYQMTNLTSITGIEYLNTSNVTNMASMFAVCKRLSNIDVSHFNTAQVKDMSAMFEQCSFTSIDVSNFDTSNVTNMVGMFYNNKSLETLDISNFVIPDSTNFYGNGTQLVFVDCQNLKTLILPSTAYNFKYGTCTRVGTQSAPCTLIYPADFTPEKTSEGDGWYMWKGGYFKDKVQFPLGDVNHDGYITVVDASLTVDYVMGNNPPVFFIENADMNSDGSVSITDASKIVDMVLNGSASHAPATSREATMDRLWLTANGGHCLLHLDTPERYTAMHITLRLPEGASMGNVRLSSTRSAGHQVETRALADGLYNVVLYANNNSELRSDDTALLHFDIAGCQPRDVEVVAIQSTNRLFETIMSSGTTTGIDIVETDDATDGDSYNTVGVRVGKNARGVVIKNGRKKIEN